MCPDSEVTGEMCSEGEKGTGGREDTGNNFTLILMETREKKTWHPPIALYLCPTSDGDDPSSPRKPSANTGLNNVKAGAGVGRGWHLGAPCEQLLYI